jgi:hypothetical protein
MKSFELPKNFKFFKGFLKPGSARVTGINIPYESGGTQ